MSAENDKRLTGMPPLLSANTHLLVLGSFPGAVSLATQRYYGHPQNHFLKILRALWPDHTAAVAAGDYDASTRWMLGKGVGLWDVFAACKLARSFTCAWRIALSRLPSRSQAA